MEVQLNRLLRFDRWGNLEALRSLREAPTPPRRALEIMAHLAATYELWLSRIERHGSVVIWPDADLLQIEASLQRTHERFVELLEERGEHIVEYVNTKGERWRSSVDEIITHIVIHSGYHRGQIALLLGSAGAAPAYTDFIQASRAKLI